MWSNWDMKQITQTLTKQNAGGGQRMPDKENFNAVVEDEEYIIRRLTPTECARLQGMPDWWMKGIENPNPSEEDMEKWRAIFNTWDDINGVKHKSDAQIKKFLAKPYSDSSAYKAYGNGMALPCVLYVMEGIVAESEN